MPVLAVLLFIVQIAFAVHAVRTGRDRFWVYLIIFIPGIGCLLYFITQVLPDIGRSSTVRRAGDSLVKAIDPQRELRRRTEELAISDSVENRIGLADECMEANFIDEAISLYAECLEGPFRDDPDIMLKLAKAHIANDQPKDSRDVLERLIEANPNYRSTDGHLLYARSLEGVGMFDEAYKEYDALLESYPGEEARARYALLLKRQGKTERANVLFKEILIRAKRGPKYYRAREIEWIRIAEQN